jgi:RNA polymerase sigma factor (TIGR02999 family)
VSGSNEATPSYCEQASCERTGCERALSSRELFAEVYSDLHRMAARELRRSSAVVSPTTLIHETFLNLSHRQFADETHFLAYAARAMRGLLISEMRHRGRQKRGGDFHITSLPTELPLAADCNPTLDALADALEELAKFDARLAECVDLKFICGFTFCDIAQLWNVSERTVLRDWDKARILLHRLIREAQSEPRAAT